MVILCLPLGRLNAYLPICRKGTAPPPPEVAIAGPVYNLSLLSPPPILPLPSRAYLPSYGPLCPLYPRALTTPMCLGCLDYEFGLLPLWLLDSCLSVEHWVYSGIGCPFVWLWLPFIWLIPLRWLMVPDFCGAHGFGTPTKHIRDNGITKPNPPPNILPPTEPDFELDPHQQGHDTNQAYSSPQVRGVKPTSISPKQNGVLPSGSEDNRRGDTPHHNGKWETEWILL
ncbi:hypothetical protein G9A89_000354 [Geosiphon pyriformis]|nr:hypothetical protein G9A89_000354 [Geosiphon pyriformis]